MSMGGDLNQQSDVDEDDDDLIGIETVEVIAFEAPDEVGRGQPALGARSLARRESSRSLVAKVVIVVGACLATLAIASRVRRRSSLEVFSRRLFGR